MTSRFCNWEVVGYTISSVKGCKGLFLCWLEMWVVVEGTTCISTVFMQGSDNPRVYLDSLTLSAALFHFSASDTHICVLDRQNYFNSLNYRKCCCQWCPQQILLAAAVRRKQVSVTGEETPWKPSFSIHFTFFFSTQPLIISPSHYFSFWTQFPVSFKSIAWLHLTVFFTNVKTTHWALLTHCIMLLVDKF